MIGLFTGGSLCILTAGNQGTTTGYADNIGGLDFGNIIRSPLGVLSLSSKLLGLYHGSATLFLFLRGDQTATTGSHTLDIDGTTYAVSAATVSYDSGNDRTQISWSTSSPFTSGQNYIIGFDD